MRQALEYVVTTARQPTPAMVAKARRLASELPACYKDRRDNSLEELARDGIVVAVEKEAVAVHTAGGKLFFHLSMARLRLKSLQKGQRDHMVDAMRLSEGMTVLDCTLGLGTDAVVASYAAGISGRVVGVEASPLLAMIAREGLRDFAGAPPAAADALRRVSVVTADYAGFLAAQAANSFDVVYFDQMFRRPVDESSNLKPLRYLADHRPVDLASLGEARRVAARRIVLKEARGSGEFARWGCDYLVGGKYSSIQYGVIEL